MNESTTAEQQAEVDRHNWFHSIDFGSGVVSKGAKTLDVLAREHAALLGGLDFTGKSVLDIGAWDGAFSFAAKRAGASRVVAADYLMWNDPFYQGRITFELARKALGLDIEAVEVDVDAVNPARVGRFDVVLFLGVFYHLFDAPKLTRQVSACATDLLILETHQDAINVPRPAMVMYPGRVLNNDPSNWWGPNPQCVYELLSEAGFSRVFYQDYPGEGITNPSATQFRQRGIYHAFRDDAALSRFIAFPGAKNWHDFGRSEQREKIFAGHDSIDALRQRAETAEHELALIRNSRSWRWTAKFRRS